MPPAGLAGSHMENPRRISVARLLTPHWKTLAIGLLASIACSVMDLLQPWPLKIVIDYVLIPGDSKKLPAFLQTVMPHLAADRVALLNATALSLIGIALAGAVGSYIQNMTMTG